MYEVKWRMSNDECRINDEIRMTKPRRGQDGRDTRGQDARDTRGWPAVSPKRSEPQMLLYSSLIRHSGFVIRH